MAILLFGGGIIDARGSVSGNTLSRCKFGATMRAKTSPIIPVSGTRGAAQGSLVSWSRAWSQTLNDSQRAQWNAFALTNPATNVFGQVSYLSGQQWYVRCNVNIAMLSGTAITVPPVSGSFPGFTDLSIEADAGTPGTLTLSYANDTLPGTPYINIFATPNLSRGLYYVNSQLRRIGSVAFVADTYDATDLWTGRFPGLNIIAGRKLFVLANLIDQDSGISSPGIIASDIVS